MLQGILFLLVFGALTYAHRSARRSQPHLFAPKVIFSPDYGLGPGVVLEHIRALIPESDRRVLLMPDAVATVEPAHVWFKPGEPTTFEEYDGQAHVVGYLSDAVRGMADDELAIAPQMFLGMAGLGKTLLAKVVANELRVRAERVGLPLPHFYEWFPADIPNVERLDELVREVAAHPGSVVLIDEIHELKESHTLKLYLVLEEGRYKYAGESQPIKLPPLTLVGATTDWGAVHPALKRRWQSHQLKPATEAQLVEYVSRRVPIAAEAARLIVDRTKLAGAPWESIQLAQMAWTTAKARGEHEVAAADVERVFEVQEIDKHGLRWQDRRVMQVLFTQPRFRMVKKEPVFVAFAASEQNVVTLAGIDKGEYRETVRPRLMARGLMEVRATYGQSLTARAAEVYGYLRENA